MSKIDFPKSQINFQRPKIESRSSKITPYMEANLKGLKLASMILIQLPEIQNYAQNWLWYNNVNW